MKMPKINKQETRINKDQPVRSIVFGYRADAFTANPMDEFLNHSSPKEKFGDTTPKQAAVDFTSKLAFLNEKSSSKNQMKVLLNSV